MANREFVTDWRPYTYFSREEFKCKHTNKRHPMAKDLLDFLQGLRIRRGKPVILSSAFRHPTHPIEAKKASPGEHSKGLCVDIQCSGSDALSILDYATELGVPRIGINQKGPISGRFIHIGFGTSEEGHVSPHIWSY